MTNAARILAFSVLCAACAQDASPAADGSTDMPSVADAPAPALSRIDVAMGGAPMAIAAQARILEMDASGGMVELRPGSNGWLCIVDDTPAAPGDSPNCLDERWQRWFDAYAKGETPKIDGIGVAYMLQGSLSPSNTDPLAVTPPAGADWMVDGPHMMVIAPDPAMLRGFPTEHGHGGPYVMFAGTPYAHLMVPVAQH